MSDEPTRRAVLAGGATLGAAMALAPLIGDIPAAAAEHAGVAAPPATRTLSFVVNGDRRRLPVDVRASLLDTLRDQLDLNGPKKGCNQGACGACTVLLNGKRALSCMTFAVMHDGHEVTTVEGLAHGDRLHPVQQAFIEHDAFQCGFCTSGQVVSAVGMLAENPGVTKPEIAELMSGNLCRCAAYCNIRDAIADVAESEAG